MKITQINWQDEISCLEIWQRNTQGIEFAIQIEIQTVKEILEIFLNIEIGYNTVFVQEPKEELSFEDFFSDWFTKDDAEYLLEKLEDKS